MKFVLIFGPQAVGKMTVGHEHEKMIDLKLFHNHITIKISKIQAQYSLFNLFLSGCN